MSEAEIYEIAASDDDEQQMALELDAEIRVLAVRERKSFAWAPMTILFGISMQRDEDPDAVRALEWACASCENEAVAILVAVEGDDQDARLRGLCILEDSRGVWSPHPWCLYFYAGGTAARKALVDAGVEWLKSRGSAGLMAINRTGASDEAHGRLFREHFESGPFGTVLEMRLREDEQ